MMHLTIYTDRLIPAWMGGMAIGPVILIRLKYRHDTGMLEHEKVHVGQFWSNPVLFGLRYKFSRKWRTRYEVEAYREQAKHYADDRRVRLAQHLATRYDLGISEAEALRLIRGAE